MMSGDIPVADQGSSSKAKAIVPMNNGEAENFVNNSISLSSLELLTLDRCNDKYLSYFHGLCQSARQGPGSHSYTAARHLLPKLLRAYREALTLSSFNQALSPSEQDEALEGKRLWAVVAEMLSTGAMKKGVLGIANHSYYAYVFKKGELVEVEVITAPAGTIPSYQNSQSISVKDELKDACQRYLDHQAFVKELRENLIYWMGLADLDSHHRNYYRYLKISSEGDVDTILMIQEIIQSLERKDWKLATAAIRLVHGYDKLYEKLYPAYLLKILQETSGLSTSTCQEKIREYSELLILLSDKFAQRSSNIPSLSGLDVARAILGLPDVLKDARVHLMHHNPFLFDLDLKNGFQLLRYTPRVQVPLFNKMHSSKKIEALENERGGDKSVLYTLLTGDFTGDYLNRGVGIYLFNHLHDWFSHKIDLSGLTWEDEFTAERLQDSSKPSVIRAGQLFVVFGFNTQLFALFRLLTPAQQTLLFYGIFDTLKKVAQQGLPWQLLRLFAVLDSAKALELFYASHEDQISGILRSLLKDGPDEISLILKMNTHYEARKSKPPGWEQLIVELKIALLSMNLHDSLIFVEKQTEDLVMLFLEQIRIFLSTGSASDYFDRVNNVHVTRDLNDRFLLGLLKDSELQTLGTRNHFTLSRLLEHGAVKDSKDRAIYAAHLLKLAKATPMEFKLHLSLVEQEANRKFMDTLETMEPSLLLELIRLSTAESLANALQKLLTVDTNLFASPTINPEGMRKLLEKVATLPLHPCYRLLNPEETFNKYGCTFIALAPQSEDKEEEKNDPFPPPYPSEYMQTLNARDEEIKQLKSKIAELEKAQNAPQNLSGTGISKEEVKQMLAQQTVLLLHAFRAENSDKVKQLEAENNRLRTAHMVITSVLYPKKGVPAQVAERLSKSGVFSHI